MEIEYLAWQAAQPDATREAISWYASLRVEIGDEIVFTRYGHLSRIRRLLISIQKSIHSRLPAPRRLQPLRSNPATCTLPRQRAAATCMLPHPNIPVNLTENFP